MAFKKKTAFKWPRWSRGGGGGGGGGGVGRNEKGIEANNFSDSIVPLIK